nr:uncharacterized protein LOC111518012 isoform X1 [Leptinotarsa decemlineata]
MMTSEVLMLVPILIVVLFFLVIISCIFWAYYKASRELSRLRDSCLRNHVILTADTHTAELAVFTNTMHLHTLHRQLSDEELSVEDEIDHVRIVNELTKPPSYEEPPSYEMALIIEASNQRNENFNSTE